ncbi:MAG TPA: ABC transporter transmembrane domain-containing protein, partial [Myxococcota bacterium]|nr:ABC transporter transmembrane domain-containing protein [Myxococcota bacterium]
MDQKGLVVAIALLTMAPHVFWSISPFLITYVFELASLPLCLAMFGAWFIVNLAETLGYSLNAKFQLQIIHSIHQNAHQQLLVIDPRYHTHRSSGAILGKIDRAARGYEDLLDQILLEFSPILIGLITTIFSLAYYSLWLTATVTCLFAAIIVSGYYFATRVSMPYEKKFIGSDDAFRATAVENLAQVHLVRATFASEHMSDKLTANIKNNMKNERSLWSSYTYANLLLRTLYLVALLVVVMVLLWQINQGSTTVIAATALAIAYLRNTQLLLRIIGPFRRYMRGFNAVKDLFSFIPGFGKQTYPVLGHTYEFPISPKSITIKAMGISFDYETARLFNNHNLLLSCPEEQTNKLYGIIGASGSGKTTLLSIL